MIRPFERTRTTGRAYSSDGSLIFGLKVDTGLLCVLF